MKQVWMKAMDMLIKEIRVLREVEASYNAPGFFVEEITKLERRLGRIGIRSAETFTINYIR